MSLETTLYQGQSQAPLLLIQDANAEAYAHASILEVWAVFIHEDDKGKETVLPGGRFSKNAKTGYSTMVTEAGAGEYSCLLERSVTKTWPEDGKIHIEVSSKLDSSVYAEEYIYVDKTHIFNLAKAQTKSI